jgi:hypothetical protein
VGFMILSQVLILVSINRTLSGLRRIDTNG